MDSLRLTALIHRALDGNKGALRLLARRVLPLINARVRQRVRPRGGADDFEIDTMVQVLWIRTLDDVRLRGVTDGDLDLPALVLEICDDQIDDVLGDVPPPRAEVTADPTLAPLWAHLQAELDADALLAFRLMYTDGRSPRTVARLLLVDEAQVADWQSRIRAAATQWSATGRRSSPS